MSPTIANYGEDRLVAALLAELPPPGWGVETPPGDDCAVVRCGRGRDQRRQLLKTDCVIEGIHFAPDTPPELVGWKALCRPLSDIAAMGGTPEYALITLALAPDTPLERARGIYAGIGRAAREFGVDVAGGETARSPGPCFINVCLTGEAARGGNGDSSGKEDRQRQRGLRSGGKPGDWLYVTGRLGGSFESGRHLTFRPRLEEGRWLVKHFPIRAMMDLSDGLGADLPRLARLSGVGFRLERDRLPCHAGCTPTQALGDGEDYELLFAVGPRRAKKLERAWAERFSGLALTRVGELTAKAAGEPLATGGFDHFAV